MIYEAREGKANGRMNANGDERLLRHAYTTRKRNVNEENGDGMNDGKSCRDWHVWNASVGYSSAQCFDFDPVYIRSKIPREGGQLTRTAHAKKGPQYARGAVHLTEASTPSHKIFSNSVRNRFDLGWTGQEWKKKKMIHKNQLSLINGLCRKCRHLPERTVYIVFNGTCYVPDMSRSYLMVCGRTRFCRNSFEIVPMTTRSQNEEMAVLQLLASPLETPYIYLICCDTKEFKCD